MIKIFKPFILTCVAIGFALLNGCATVKESYAADGRKAYALNCSGTARGWDKCYAAAGELCKSRGYDILNRIGEENAGIVGSSQGLERSMLVACKS